MSRYQTTAVLACSKGDENSCHYMKLIFATSKVHPENTSSQTQGDYLSIYQSYSLPIPMMLSQSRPNTQLQQRLPITMDHRAVVCDTCDRWYHIDCQDVNTGTDSILNDDSAIRWDCIVCNNPNFTTVGFDLPSISTDNPYSVLSISSTSIPGPGVNHNIKPIHSSTPERKQHQTNKPAKNRTPTAS